MTRRPSDQLVVAVRPAICAAAMNSSSRRLSMAYCADPGKSVDGKPHAFRLEHMSPCRDLQHYCAQKL